MAARMASSERRVAYPQDSDDWSTSAGSQSARASDLISSAWRLHSRARGDDEPQAVSRYERLSTAGSGRPFPESMSSVQHLRNAL